MAKPTWLSISPVSGTADGSFNMTAGLRSGRKDRSAVDATLYPDEINGSVTVTGPSGAKPIDVDQYGVAVYTCTTTAISIPSAAQSSNKVQGVANAEKLTFKVWDNATKAWSTTTGIMRTADSTEEAPETSYRGENAPIVTIDGNWTCTKSSPLSGSLSATNGVVIDGDPGSVSQYNFEVNVMVDTNKTIKACITKVGVFEGDKTTPSSVIDVTIVAGASFLEVYEDEGHKTKYISHTFAAAGETDTVYVDTNDTWTVS